MRRYLVIANQTLAARGLLEYAHRCRSAGPCWFHVLVPATPIERQLEPPATDATLLARRRLAAALARFNAEGITATGEIGDPDPLRAVCIAVGRFDFDEIILSTLPIGASQWLLDDLPTRLAAVTSLRFTHIVAAGQPVSDRAPLNT
jgi:hypothetical protein